MYVYVWFNNATKIKQIIKQKETHKQGKGEQNQVSVKETVLAWVIAHNILKWNENADKKRIAVSIAKIYANHQSR